MKTEECNALFSCEKIAQQQLSSIVFRDLQQEPVKLSNCATNINLRPDTNWAPAETNWSMKQSCRHTGKHVVSNPLEKYHCWRNGHKKTKKKRYWNKKALDAQMGVDSNAERVYSNANSQPLLAISPFDYCVRRCDISQFLCDTTTADERLS